MTLSENEYRVLNVLLKDPSLSYTEIAQILNLSVTSIRNLLFSLMDYTPTSSIEDDDSTPVSTKDSYINPEPKKNNHLNFFAKFNFDLLNLKRFDFFITCSTIEQMKNVKNFCLAHPYTNFRSTIHGGKSGIYVLFTMPPEILDMLIFALEALKREHLIDDYKQLIKETNFTIFSLLKIDVFDVNQNRWNFDFDTFKENFHHYESKSNSNNYFKKTQGKSILSKFDKIDVIILNEWGYGAGTRKTKAELLNNITTFPIYSNYIKDLKLNRYIISDHVDFLQKETIIKDIGIGFDRKKIQILTTLFYLGEAKVEFLNNFANFIQSDEFPFESTLSVGDLNSESKIAKYTWWVNFTADNISEFTEFLFENSFNLQTFIVILNSGTMENYPLYHANFIIDSSNTGHWNTTEDSCLLMPLKPFFDSSKTQSLIKDYQKVQMSSKKN